MLKLTSSAFSNQGEMPAVYAGTSCGEGDNLSPPLEWLDTPDGTQSLALIVQDPDAPRGTF
ncbi:MAG TPA: hypothetical protein VF171_06215, partial [Trueperaceae bacterium]